MNPSSCTKCIWEAWHGCTEIRAGLGVLQVFGVGICSPFARSYQVIGQCFRMTQGQGSGSDLHGAPWFAAGSRMQQQSVHRASGTLDSFRSKHVGLSMSGKVTLYLTHSALDHA